MTRWKKYLRENGIKLGCDYDWLPMEIGAMSIEGVTAKLYPHSISVTTYYSSIVCKVWYAAKTGKICRKEFY